MAIVMWYLTHEIYKVLVLFWEPSYLTLYRPITKLTKTYLQYL